MAFLQHNYGPDAGAKKYSNFMHLLGQMYRIKDHFLRYRLYWDELHRQSAPQCLRPISEFPRALSFFYNPYNWYYAGIVCCVRFRDVFIIKFGAMRVTVADFDRSSGKIQVELRFKCSNSNWGHLESSFLEKENFRLTHGYASNIPNVL